MGAADAGPAWSSNSAFQPRKFTTYDRDGNGSDEAMLRRYNRWHSRVDQPDPSGASYNVGDPQSFIVTATLRMTQSHLSIHSARFRARSTLMLTGALVMVVDHSTRDL